MNNTKSKHGLAETQCLLLVLNYSLEIKLTDKEAGILKAGMYVSARITAAKAATGTGLMVSRAAIIESLKNPEVYVVRDGKACKQKITVAQVSDNYITVANGLNEGDLVVVAGQINLVDGRNVEVK